MKSSRQKLLVNCSEQQRQNSWLRLLCNSAERSLYDTHMQIALNQACWGLEFPALFLLLDSRISLLMSLKGQGLSGNSWYGKGLISMQG